MHDEMKPPAWAEAVLLALLPAERAQSVSGDLLEAYRDEHVPRRGRAGANRWYVWQVGGWLVCASLPWLAVVVIVFGADRLLLRARSVDLIPIVAATLLELAIVLAAGVVAGWRTGRVLGGVPVSLGVMAGYWVINVTWLVTRFGFSLPLVTAWGPRALALGLTAGLVGGMIGAAARATSRPLPPPVGA
jgi:hypothetical protein